MSKDTSEGYLVLTRNEGQEITITVPASQQKQTIKVKCLRSHGKQSRLGFSAERDINIARNELLERDKEAKAV